MSIICVVLCTAQDYAAPVLDMLDPGGRLFAHRLYRHNCLPVPSSFHHSGSLMMKDLSSLGRNLAATFMVDNTPQVRLFLCLAWCSSSHAHLSPGRVVACSAANPQPFAFNQAKAVE